MHDPSEEQALRTIAHRRALMLGSIAFPPAAHLAYLRTTGRSLAAGLAPIQIGDLTVRDVQWPDERQEVIRVISETAIKYGLDHEGLSPSEVNTIPARLLAGDLTWFGVYVGGRLNGLHGGFLWDERLWIRRAWMLIENPYPWETHFAIDGAIYAHLWDLGMREAMIQVHDGAPSLEGYRAEGWHESHAVYTAHQRARFVWLRRTFATDPARRDVVPFRSADPAWQART